MSAEPIMAETTFEAGKYLTEIQGRAYLEVKWRLLWLRTEHPDAAIETELVRDEGSVAVFKATVRIPGGGSATGWGQESERDFPDYLEKAETKALGRALAALGYGTQFCQDFDFGADRGRAVDGNRPADLLTEKQLKAIYAIGHGRGMTEAQVTEFCQGTFGVTPEQLERRDASAFIDRLKQAKPAEKAPTPIKAVPTPGRPLQQAPPPEPAKEGDRADLLRRVGQECRAAGWNPAAFTTVVTGRWPTATPRADHLDIDQLEAVIETAVAYRHLLAAVQQYNAQWPDVEAMSKAIFGRQVLHLVASEIDQLRAWVSGHREMRYTPDGDAVLAPVEPPAAAT